MMTKKPESRRAGRACIAAALSGDTRVGSFAVVSHYSSAVREHESQDHATQSVAADRLLASRAAGLRCQCHVAMPMSVSVFVPVPSARAAGASALSLCSRRYLKLTFPSGTGEISIAATTGQPPPTADRFAIYALASSRPRPNRSRIGCPTSIEFYLASEGERQATANCRPFQKCLTSC